MKTRMFVAEVLWLFIGMCMDPQSDEGIERAEQCTSQSTTRTVDESLKTWTVSGGIRPPPLGNQSTLKTIQ